MALPAITASGNLTQDIELNITKTGKSVATAKIACNERKFENNQWVDGDTTYLTCVLWGTTAEHAVSSLGKGDAVNVTGKLTQRKYQAKDGTEKTVTEVVVDSFGPDLRRTAFTKNAVKKTTQVTNDAWNMTPTDSDNNLGVGF